MPVVFVKSLCYSEEGEIGLPHNSVFAEFSIYMAVWEWSVQDAVVSLDPVCVCVRACVPACVCACVHMHI